MREPRAVEVERAPHLDGAPRPMLHVDNLEAFYGRGEQILRGLSLTVLPGSVTGLLGSNGAGKTTTLRAVSGTVRSRGTVLLDGVAVAGSPEQRARLGIAHVPEGRQIFSSLTVAENLLLGREAVPRRLRDAGRLDGVLALFPELVPLLGRAGGWLSGGEQQMVAIGRALMAQPRLFLLDEPTMGLAPVVVERLADAVVAIARGGAGVLVAEENVAFLSSVSDSVSILHHGRVAWAGPPATLGVDVDVHALLLGAA